MTAILHVMRIKFPGSGTRKRRYIDTLWNVDRTREFIDVF